jgi:hypothetical protein
MGHPIRRPARGRARIAPAMSGRYDFSMARGGSPYIATVASFMDATLGRICQPVTFLFHFSLFFEKIFRLKNYQTLKDAQILKMCSDLKFVQF